MATVQFGGAVGNPLELRCFPDFLESINYGERIRSKAVILPSHL
jgi:hypothetical protein